MEGTPFFSYGEDALSASLALGLAEGRVRGRLGAEALEKVEASRARALELAAGADAVYGVNTGFGPLCTSRVSAEDTRALQVNLLLSHASGTGEPIAPLLAKLMLILKVHALSLGHSGVARETLERILWHIEEDVIPVVPCQGSVGASGDLAPLAHLFLPLLGHGKVHVDGTVRPAGEVLAAAGLEPIALGPKEGLALINGTQFIAAHSVASVARLHAALDQADLAGAMTLEARLGAERPFTEALHATRPHPGPVHVAARLRQILAGSAMMESHRGCAKVQDPYSLRCMPQIHGASRAAWLHLKDTLETEINAVTDNPVLVGDDAISGGAFHGQPLALPVDYAALAASELGNVSDRRTYLLLEGDGEELPRLLLRDTGLQSGFMILQYTSAALASENKGLCFPSSADSIPTSLGQEDHVSMGSIGARKLLRVIDNVERILAVELLAAAQALDFRRPLRSSPALEAVHGLLREHVDHATADRVFAEDLEETLALVRSTRLLAAAEAAAESSGCPLVGGGNPAFRSF